MANAEAKATLSVEVGLDLIERARIAVQLTPGTTLESLVEDSLREGIAKLERERGKPFPLPLSPSRLTSFALFADSGEETLAEILPAFEEESFSQGDLLFRQGQVVSVVYLLEEGSLGIFHGSAGGDFSTVLQAPALVGGKDLMDSEHIRSVSATALTNLRMLSIKLKPFITFVKSSQPLKDKLRKIVVEGGY